MTGLLTFRPGTAGAMLGLAQRGEHLHHQGYEINHRDIFKRKQKGKVSMRSFVFIGLLAFAQTGFSKGDVPTETPVLAESKLDLASVPFTPMTESQYQEAVKAAKKRSTRRVASATGIDYEAMMSEDFKKIRNEILLIKTPQQIDPLIEKLESTYNELSADSKLLAAELVLLKPLKGFVYRLAPLAAKSNVTHSVLLTYVMSQAAMMRTYFPQKQAEALFSYVTQPYDGVSQFREGEDLQAYIGDIMYPAISKSLDRVKAVSLLEKPAVWDNKLLYSSLVDSKVDTQDRYTLLGPAEQTALLLMKQMALHNISVFRAYTVKGTIQLAKQLGSLYGIDGFTSAVLANGAVDGVTSAERANVIRKADFRGTFIIYADGKAWMGRAFEHLKESVKLARILWEEVKDKPASENLLLNPAYFSGFERQIDKNLVVWEEMVKGETKLHSRLTGETVTVDIAGFYARPPTDLKALLPTRFDTTEKFSTAQIKMGSDQPLKQVSYYNYFRGRPVEWNKKMYKSLFPKIEQEGDIGAASRILAQSWGGAVFAGPLNAVIQ